MTKESEHLQIIEWIFSAANKDFFQGIIPKPTFRLSTRMTQCAGKVNLRTWSMALSVPYHDRYGWDDEIMDTVVHECIHLYLRRCGQPFHHGKMFKAIAQDLGVTVWAKPMPEIPYRYILICVQCGVVGKARQRRGHISCGRCSSVYDSRYELKYEKIA
jgi:predicted SprT family Zn-dependent metalloprotease